MKDNNKLETILEKLLKNEYINNNQYYKNELLKIKESNDTNELRIIIVGEFSSGKSTFINALIGKDLLSHATIETTSVITYIYNVRFDSLKNGICEIEFWDGTKENLENLGDIKEYTTTINNTSDIKSVSYYTNFLNNDANLVLIDTPGFNGMTKRHRELTLGEMRNAHLAVYLFSLRGITSTDISQIRVLSSYQKNIIYVQNFIDELKRSEGDFYEDKIEEIRDILLQNIDDIDAITIFGVSALYALVYKDKSIMRIYNTDTENLTDEMREEYYEKSNFKEFEEYLFKVVAENSNLIKLKNFKYSLEVIIGLLLTDLSRKKNIYDNVNKVVNKQAVDKIKEKIRECNENAPKNWGRINDFIENQSLVISQNIRREGKDKIRVLDEELSIQISDIQKIEELEEYIKSGEFNNLLKEKVDKIYDEMRDIISICIQNLYESVILKMQDFQVSFNEANDNSTKLDIEFSSDNKDDINNQEISITQNLEEIRKYLSSKYVTKKNSEEIVKDNKEILEDEKKQLEKQIILYEKIREEKFNSEMNFEEKPIKKAKIEYGYETVENTSKSKVYKFLFGKKMETKRVAYEVIDDTEIKEWEGKRKKLEIYYQEEIDRISNNISRYKKNIMRIEAEERIANNNIEKMERDISFYEKLISDKEDELLKFRKKAKYEFFNVAKKNLLEQIHKKCISEDAVIYNMLEKDITNNIDFNLNKLKEETKRYFDLGVKEEIEFYTNSLTKKEEDIKEDISYLEDNIKIFYEFEEDLKSES